VPAAVESKRETQASGRIVESVLDEIEPTRFEASPDALRPGRRED
jgi:hypothetical protein